MPSLEHYLAQLPVSARPIMDFFEVAPENWIQWAGQHSQSFARLTQAYPFVSHGLSLSLGGPDPLRQDFIGQIKRFLDEHRMLMFSEHLSYSSDGGQLYDLMPIPLTWAMVEYVAQRIMQVQEILGRRIAIENVSVYVSQANEMSELEFLLAVVQRADCNILLDVNNVYVNSMNHEYDPAAYIQALPTARIAYLHIAGHCQEEDQLIIDTHGAPVSPDVWQLLELTYACHGVQPTLLERDCHYPAFDALVQELAMIQQLQNKCNTIPRGLLCHC